MEKEGFWKDERRQRLRGAGRLILADTTFTSSHTVDI